MKKAGEGEGSTITENQPPPTSHQSEQNGVLRDAVLTAEFLDRCEMQGTNLRGALSSGPPARLTRTARQRICQARFEAHRIVRRVADVYDQWFCRMWEFYLAGCEAGFRHGGLVNFQIQLSKRVDTVPLIRDYVFDWERSHAKELLTCPGCK